MKASFWFLICTVLQRSVTIITTPIYTRLLSASEYGQYSVFISWMGILTCFVTLYIYSGIYPQALVKYDSEKNQYSSAMQGFTFILVIFWVLIYLFTDKFWNSLFNLTTSQMLAMFVIMWSHAIFGFWSAEQRVEYKYKKLVIVTLANAVIQPILCVVLISNFSERVTALVWGMAIANCLCYFSLFATQMINGKVFFSKKIWAYSLKLGIPLIPHYISGIILNNSDRIMIEKLVGAEEAGIYNLAYTIAICGVMINQAMLQTLQPWLFQKVKSKEYASIEKIAYPALIFIACVNLIFILLTPELVKIFAPSSYYDAIWVMPPISMSVYFMFAYNLFSTFEFYYEKTSYISTATAIGAVLNIVLNYVFINIFGYYAAGYTTLVCYIAFAICHYMFMKIICKKELESVAIYDVKKIVMFSVAFLSLGFFFMFTYSSNALRYTIIAATVILSVLFRNKIMRFGRQLLKFRTKPSEK